MMEEMSQRGLSFELHYSVRDEQGDAYGSELLQRYPADVHLYRTRTGGRMPLRGILELQPLGTHLYVCGPAQMIESVTSQAFQAGWPADSIHFERFAADAGNRHSFEVELAKSKRVLEVSGDQSLLEAIEDAGVEAPYLCRGGACGRCETAVLKGTATLLHRDHYLSDGERAAGNKIMLCVSRASGGRLLLDL
jgi:ferredoxin